MSDKCRSGGKNAVSCIIPHLNHITSLTIIYRGVRKEYTINWYA